MFAVKILISRHILNGLHAYLYKKETPTTHALEVSVYDYKNSKDTYDKTC